MLLCILCSDSYMEICVGLQGQGNLWLSRKGRSVSCILTQLHPPLADMILSILLMFSMWCTTARSNFLDWRHFHVILSKRPEKHRSWPNQNNFILCTHLVHQPRCYWTFLQLYCVIKSWLSFSLIFDWHGAVPYWIGSCFSLSVFLSVSYK